MQAAVATSEIHAARVGARVLRAGGTAVDAAVATAAALVVTEPTSNGLGGDLFALVWDGAGVLALDAAGASPRGLDVEALRRQAKADVRHTMPTEGWGTVTVPGAVSGWQALHERCGRLPWAELLAPAVRLAREGFSVGPATAAAWARAVPRLGHSSTWRDAFLPGGRPPAAGEGFSHPHLADSLELLAREGAGALYRGELGRALVQHAEQTGGWLGSDDLDAHQARWVDPLAVSYGSARVVGMTAPTQGVVALQALAMLDGLAAPDQATALHLEVEAIKRAFAEAYATVADPESMDLDAQALLEPTRVAHHRAALDPHRAAPPPPPPGLGGGTVLLCVVDHAGRAASLIQSNYMGFGSGIVVPGTGMALHNRGAGFRLHGGHPNSLAPGKRPFHTILPGLLVDDGGVAPFGCMGGQMQPQGHVQLVRALARGATARQAVSAPRWRWRDAGSLDLEVGFSPELAADLERRGHPLRRAVASHDFGGAQLLRPRGDGTLDGGSDPRKDGGVVSA